MSCVGGSMRFPDANEVAAALVKDRARFLDDMLIQQVGHRLLIEQMKPLQVVEVRL